MAHLSLALLGPLQVRLDGALVTAFESDKVRALLAYLAVEADRPHRRAALAGLLWPERPERAAHLSLNQALSNLRRAIGDRTAPAPFLRITPETIQWNVASDYDLDVAAFIDLLATCDQHAHRHLETCTSCAQRRQQAAELYRGRFLDQFFLSDSAAFEEWALLKRERLHRRALQAFAHLANYHERRGDYAQAQHDAWRQLELDPWREESHRQLMRVLALSGQRSAALVQYEMCRRVLAEELGVEPDEETTALYERIRDGEPRTTQRAPDQEPRTGRTHHTMLPVPPTPLIGRETELAELGDLLANPACRLITIVGPGGIGKTRLALAAAAEQADTFTHGAVFVPLAAISSAAFLAHAIITALNIALQGQRDLHDQLLEYLREKELLLVLDNVEQLLAGADLLANVLHHAPGVTLLVTSRQRLALQAEWLFDLAGLSYPAGEPDDNVEGYSAVRLFLQRAGQVRRQFALAEGEARAVARICQLVEGLPLAIELAAAALRVRSCTAIAAALETSLSALATGLRAIPERHRSIWATFEHSWRLLTDEERQVFPRLAVFRGGFQEDAAASVAQASPQLLAALVDKSLLRWDGAARYDMHELVRQYASEKLEQAGEAGATRKQHAMYFLELAETTEPHLHGPDQVARLDCLEVENDNLRAALRWFIEGENLEGGLRLGAALWWFWWERGYLSEGRRWLDKVLATVDSGSELPNQFNTVIRARALNGAGVLASEQSDYDRAQRLLNESLALFRELGDKHGTAISLRYLGRVMLYSGDFDRAIVLLQESLVLFRELEEKQSIAALLNHLGLVALYQGHHEQVALLCQESLTLFRELADKQGIAVSLHNLGWAALSQGDYERGTRFCEESLALLRELKHTQGIAALLIDLGYAALYQNELERASALCLESLGLYQQIGNKEGIVFCLEGLAGIAATSQPVRAARLFAIAHALRSTIAAPLPPLYRTGYDRYLAATRAQLDEATFAAAWAAGREMTMEQAVAEALADDRAHSSSS